MRNLTVLILMFLVTPSPAHASVLWEGSGGWSFGGTNEFGGLTQPVNPPALVTSGGDFSNNGALCPPLDAPNYICGSFYGESNLVGGGLITLRASARLRQKNFTSNGFGRIVYGGARITVVGLKFSAVASPVSQVVFNFGLHGTRLETSNNGQVTVVGKGVAYLSADAQHFIQCFADVCEPIKVNVGSNGWDPGSPNGTVFLLDLRTDATTNAPSGVVFDAEAVADFKDTLEVLSIEAQDANGAAVPGVSLVITDAQGQPMYTFPNTPPTTTPTTTQPGAATTTTLPGCASGATYAAVACRLDALIAASNAGGGVLAPKLSAKLSAARAAVAKAESVVGQRGGKATKGALRKASKALTAYRTLAGSKKARRTIADATRAALLAPLPALQSDVRALPTV